MLFTVALGLALTVGADGSDRAAIGASWPPHAYLLGSLLGEIPQLLDAYNSETGKFGDEPWICRDQNRIFPLAAAWALEDARNPYYQDPDLLAVIARGGEVLVDEMDAEGMWTFRKKDHSTWGQIHMPWTYSRWIRAYRLVRDALPETSRKRWEEGLLLGFSGIRKYMDGNVHNIPAHHAMALYIAGECFDNEDWRQAAAAFMGRVMAAQDPAGYWSEHYGPVVGYNMVYVDALGVYYHFSRNPAVLDALSRSARFHSAVLWPDGSSVSCVDERMIYSASVSVGSVGFTWVPEGRGYLLKQMALHSGEAGRAVSADLAASMLLYGGAGDSIAPAADRDEGSVSIGDDDAVVVRRKPWQWAMSGYACPPVTSRWIQDRQNLVDVYHDTLGLVAGGGNTKLQPYWSTFVVGDPELLKHTPCDENPEFTPDIALRWTPDAASLDREGPASTLRLTYGDVACAVTVQPAEDGAIELRYSASAGAGVQAHLPLLRRASHLRTADGRSVPLGEEDWVLTAEEVGGRVEFGGLAIALPPGTALRWPARQHNPYAKDGAAPLGNAKLVLSMPFVDTDTFRVVLSHAPVPPFDGLVFEARDLDHTHSEGTYTKRLDDLGSQFIGATKPGDRLAFALPEVSPGRYALLGEFVRAHSYGIVRVLLDSAPVGDIFDGYCEGVDAEGAQVSFGEVELGSGRHELAVEVVGKNDRATAMAFSVKRWLLRPIEP